MRSEARETGFTLIELLIVVAIIAILAMIAVPNFLEAQARAKVAREKAELRMIDVALEAYCVDNNEYPPWTERLGTRIHPCSWRFAWLTTPIAYITSVPMDPYALKREWDEQDNGRPNWDTYDLVTRKAQSDDQWTHGHAWRCTGFGPDYTNQYGGGRTSWNGITPPAFAQFPNFVYDPTNGTVSWGDVIRVGHRVPIQDPNVQYYPFELLPW
jgi:type II secretion system protein G